MSETFMKEHSISLLIKGMQFNTTMGYYLTLVRTAITKSQKIASTYWGHRERDSLHTFGENITFYAYYSKQ